MKPVRGKVVVLSSGVLGIAALAAAGFALQGRIREEYWIWKLEKGDEAARVLAVRKLGEMRSLRAVPRMVQCSFQSDIANEVEAVLSSLEPDVTPLLIDLSEDERASASTRMTARIMILKMAISRHLAGLEAEARALLPPGSP